MRMANRNAERIGGIACDDFLEVQQAHHHVGNLLLGGRAIAHGGELDLTRRVLTNGNACWQCTQRGTARLPQFQRAVDIAIDEHALDGGFIRDEVLQHIDDTRVNAAQALGQLLTRNVDTAVRDVHVVATDAVDDAVTRALRTGIESEDAAAAGCHPQCRCRHRTSRRRWRFGDDFAGAKSAPGLR